MTYCIATGCPKPKNAPTARLCKTCGSKLWLRDRYRVLGALGRGGTYAIKGSEEAATGFSLYMEPLLEALDSPQGAQRDTVFLPIGHDREVAMALRNQGWRTVAAISADDDAEALGCTHILDERVPRTL